MAQTRLFKTAKSPYWQAEYYDRLGNRHRDTTRCTDKRAAAEWLRQREREVHDPAHAATNPPSAPHKPSHSIASALGRLVDVASTNLSPGTVRMYAEKGGHLVRLLTENPDLPDSRPLAVGELHLDHVQRYIGRRLDEGAARETVRKELCTLSRALKLARDRGMFHGDPRALIPEFRAPYRPRERYLTTDELALLLPELSPHRQMWLLVAIYSGGRDGEVDRLCWEHLDWRNETIRIEGTKTDGAHRLIPFHPVLRDILGKERKTQGPIVGEWLNVRRDLAAACARAKIDRISPNDLRRTLASWLKQQGEDSFIVAQILGHSTSRMVELTYGKVDMGAKKRAFAKLPGSQAGVGDGNSTSQRFCTAGPQSANSLPTTSAAGSAGSTLSASTPEIQNPNPRRELGSSSVLGAGIEPATRGFSGVVALASSARRCASAPAPLLSTSSFVS